MHGFELANCSLHKCAKKRTFHKHDREKIIFTSDFFFGTPAQFNNIHVSNKNNKLMIFTLVLSNILVLNK